MSGFESLQKPRVAFVTILPSPYQLELFKALEKRTEISFSVFYMEEAAADSPWPSTERAPYETVLKGFSISVGPSRFQINWPVPDFEEFDLVVLSSYSSTLGQMLSRLKLRGRKWVFWGERMREQESSFRKIGQDFLAAPLRSATAIVGMGELARRNYAQRYPNVPVYSIPYYCDLEPYTRAGMKRVPSDRGTVRFLCCGQMIARKGIDYLVEAFDRLVRDGLPVELILVGREAELPDILKNVSPETRNAIDFRGFVAPNDLPPHFQDADVFVLPSRHDGWGVVVNQALGSGLPLILSDAVGAAYDLLEDEVNGLRFRSGDVDHLETAMRTLASDSQLRERFGDRSMTMAREWGTDAGAQKWIDVVDALLVPSDDL